MKKKLFMLFAGFALACSVWDIGQNVIVSGYDPDIPMITVKNLAGYDPDIPMDVTLL